MKLVSCSRNHKGRFASFMVCIVGLFLSSLSFAKAGVELSWSSEYGLVGDDVTLTILLDDAEALYGGQLSLSFDHAALVLKESAAPVKVGALLAHDAAMELNNQYDRDSNQVNWVYGRVAPAEAVHGEGALLDVTFTALKEGDAWAEAVDLRLGSVEGEVEKFARLRAPALPIYASVEDVPKEPVMPEWVWYVLGGAVLFVIAFLLGRRKSS